MELSVRAANCLNNANITIVGQLAMKTEADMLKYRNFGKKSLNEIKDKLVQLGLSLGMKFESGLVEPSDGQRTERGRQAGVVLTSYASREKYDQIGPESQHRNLLLANQVCSLIE